MAVREAGLSQEEPHEGLPILAFGPFRLHRRPPMLFAGDQPVRLGGRAIDLLIALAERPGEVVSRAELERQVWPHSLVEDSSLRVHIAALRKALGDGVGEARYIANVPGRGYSFVASVTHEAPHGAASAELPIGARALPIRLTSIVGRDEAVRSLCANLASLRLASIVGHGGMGKTALALAVAYQLRGRYADGACFVDLAPLSDAGLVPNALASALGVTVFGESVIESLLAWLQPRRMLIVVDNCEHVLDAATVLIDRLLRLAPGIDVLATSREPLDAEGEWVHRLTPLESPPVNTTSCEAALAYPALQLLVERANASIDSFALTEANLAGAITLCRRLDGVPLVIEFAAARVGLLGVHGVVEQLDDRLRLLGSGRRTVLPRHRTLRALLDWSYDLLLPVEQRVLRCCGIFSGPFTLEAAIAVISDGAQDAAEVRDAVLALVAKSLIASEPGTSRSHLSLLEITRAYALERLSPGPDYNALAERHARHMIELMRHCELDWEAMTGAEWLRTWLGAAGNVRAALNWAFGPGGDPAIGVRLSGAMMLQAARVLSEEELRGAARRALDAIKAGAPVEAKDEMRLHTVLANLTGPGTGLPYAEANALVPPSFVQALDDGERRRHVDDQIEALYHIGTRLFGAADYPGARGAAARVAELAAQAGNDAGIVLAERMQAQAAHFLGDHVQGRALAKTVLARLQVVLPLRLSSPVHRSVSMRIVLARSLWMQGFGAQAAAAAAECVDIAADDLTPISLAHALCLGACPVAFWRGDHDSARMLVERLEKHAQRHGMAYWAGWAQHFRRVLSARDGTAGLADIGIPTDPMQVDHLATLAPSLALPAALSRCRDGLVGWSAPEVLRVHGERVHAGGGDAEPLFAEALALSRQQQAAAWSPRCATSLARLWCAQGRRRDAKTLLAPAMAAVAEERDSRDIRTAATVLDSTA